VEVYGANPEAGTITIKVARRILEIRPYNGMNSHKKNYS